MEIKNTVAIETTARLPDGLYIDGWHHKRQTCAGRQTCCRYCHECGSRLHEVLDGELWCAKCQQYR